MRTANSVTNPNWKKFQEPSDWEAIRWAFIEGWKNSFIRENKKIFRRNASDFDLKQESLKKIIDFALDKFDLSKNFDDKLEHMHNAYIYGFRNSTNRNDFGSRAFFQIIFRYYNENVSELRLITRATETQMEKKAWKPDIIDAFTTGYKTHKLKKKNHHDKYAAMVDYNIKHNQEMSELVEDAFLAGFTASANRLNILEKVTPKDITHKARKYYNNLK